MSAAPSSIRLAARADDAAIRSLFRETTLSGKFEVTLEREPSFFDSQADAVQHDVFLATRNNQIVGCGSRVVRDAWWNGRENRTAYLGDLRVHPAVQRRAGWLIRDGYRALAQVASGSPAILTWTAIFEENAIARKVLTHRAAGLPPYLDRGRLFCPVIPVPRGAEVPHLSGVSWQNGRPEDWEDIAGFLNTQLRLRPLAPVHRAADFAGGARWPCLEAHDFILARRPDRLIGLIAVWDLRRIRQVRPAAFHGWLKTLRRPINVVARWTGWPGLPATDTILPIAFASFLAVENEEPALARALLLAARAFAARRGLGFLCACAHENHPFAKVLRRLPAIASHGRIYEVGMEGARPTWPATAPHIEPALL